MSFKIDVTEEKLPTLGLKEARNPFTVSPYLRMIPGMCKLKSYLRMIHMIQMIRTEQFAHVIDCIEGVIKSFVSSISGFVGSLSLTP